jgi:hypothetical protein
MKRLVVDAEPPATKYTDIDEGKGGNDFSVSGIFAIRESHQLESRFSRLGRFRDPDRPQFIFSLRQPLHG